MGAAWSEEATPGKELTEEEYKAMMQSKLSYAHLPETQFDDLPVRRDDKNILSMPRIPVQCLMRDQCEGGLPLDDSSRKQRAIAVQSLRERGFFIMKLSDESVGEIGALSKEMCDFFSRSTEEKEEIAGPLLVGRRGTRRLQYSGYSRIKFDNRDNRRVQWQ